MGVNEESVRQPSGTAMKPQTAAKKLGIYLPAAPEEFQATAITHAELAKLLAKRPLVSVEMATPRPVASSTRTTPSESYRIPDLSQTFV